MADIENVKAIVTRFLKAVEQGDEAMIEALQAPHCTWWIIGQGEISRQAYTDAVRMMLLTAQFRKVDIIGMIAEGGTVTAEIRSEMHFGDRVYRNEYHDLFVVEDGLITHGREYFDTAAVAAFQLGSLPA